jgi:hypothetical protein
MSKAESSQIQVFHLMSKIDDEATRLGKDMSEGK